jgi:hypothetical protein
VKPLQEIATAGRCQVQFSRRESSGRWLHVAIFVGPEPSHPKLWKMIFAAVE